MYGTEDLDRLPDVLQKVVGTTSDNNITAFFGIECPLSNFYPSRFTVDGQVFSSNEQHYYYSKASHAKDYKAQVEIMANDDPVQIKRIGKRIRGG